MREVKSNGHGPAVLSVSSLEIEDEGEGESLFLFISSDTGRCAPVKSADCVLSL